MTLRFLRNVLVSIVVLGLVGCARLASADPVLITGGFIGMFNGSDLPGFQLSGSNSQFSGILPIAGVNCCFFDGGELVTLNASFPLSSLPFQPTTQTVNGTTYPKVFVSGGLSFTSVPFVAPPPNGSPTFQFTTPFTMQGQISGFSSFNDPGQTPLFSVALIGSGTASVGGTSRSTSPNYVGQGLAFQFEAPSPTPEPASLILLGSGVAGIALTTCRRFRNRAAPRG